VSVLCKLEKSDVAMRVRLYQGIDKHRRYALIPVEYSRNAEGKRNEWSVGSDSLHNVGG